MQHWPHSEDAYIYEERELRLERGFAVGGGG